MEDSAAILKTLSVYTVLHNIQWYSMERQCELVLKNDIYCGLLFFWPISFTLLNAEHLDLDSATDRLSVFNGVAVC